MMRNNPFIMPGISQINSNRQVSSPIVRRIFKFDLFYVRFTFPGDQEFLTSVNCLVTIGGNQV
jgi:hypothetical protein